MSDSETLGLTEYLRKEGVIGILVRLDATDGLLNGALDERVHISPTTLSKRLDEGMEKDLLTETRNPGDHENAKRYLLTQRGREIQQQIQAIGMDEAYNEFFQAYQEIEQGKAELTDWVNDSRIDEPRWPPDHDPDADHRSF